jgi:hypothetical protein
LQQICRTRKSSGKYGAAFGVCLRSARRQLYRRAARRRWMLARGVPPRHSTFLRSRKCAPHAPRLQGPPHRDLLMMGKQRITLKECAEQWIVGHSTMLSFSVPVGPGIGTPGATRRRASQTLTDLLDGRKSQSLAKKSVCCGRERPNSSAATGPIASRSLSSGARRARPTSVVSRVGSRAASRG